MKTKLPSFGISMLTLVFAFFTGSMTQAFGQTNPAAQALPYSQNFGTVSFGTLPAGIAVWTPGSQQTSQANAEASTPSGDIAISARTTATTTVGVYGFATLGNANIYIQPGAAANGTGQLVAAINSGSNTSVVVSYQLSRLLTGNRTTGVSLLYRAGTTGAWTSAGSVTASVTGTTNSTVLLSGLIANTVYQLRWVTWTSTFGTATFTGITIDNISVQAPTVRTWIGGATGSWNTGTNWSGNTVPVMYDAVVFNTTASVSVNIDPALLSGLTINNPANVTLTSSGGSRELTLTNSSTALTIQGGSVLSLFGSAGFRSMTLDYSGSGNLASIAGTLNVNATGTASIYDATNSTTTVTGILSNNGGTITSISSNLIFNSGGTYIHGLDGGTIPPATWNSGSTCLITGNSGTVPGGLAPTGGFANFTWNSPGQSATDNVSFAGALKTVNGDLTITSTGSGSLRLANSNVAVTLTVGGNFLQTGGTFFILGSGGNNTSMTMTVLGNFSLSGGTLTVNGATTGSANAGIINVAGDFSHTAGTLTESASATYTSDIFFNGNTTQTYTSGGTVSNTVNFTVRSGTTLQMGTGASPSTITGGGKFTLSDGATLGVTSPNGITLTGASGNIQSTTRSYFQTLGNTSFIYNGSSAQAAGTGLPATVSIFNISNAAGVTLTNPLTINGALTLISGKIDASTKNITLGSSALVNGSGGSSSSYVITGDGVSTTGTFTRTGIVSGLNNFPVGNSTYYLPVVVNPASAQTFSVFVFQGATVNGVAGGTAIPDKTGLVDAIWDVSRSAGTGNADITLQWVDALEGANFANYTSPNIGISHFTAGAWQNAAQTAANAAANTVTNTFNSFSPFGVGTINEPLPVILVDFNAVMNSNKTVNVSWSTQQEVNSSHFDVLRSADGVNWQVIGTVQAKGNAQYISNYSFTDANPLSGVDYYRLKMVDLDGRYGYTEIKVVRTSIITGISIFPNPAKDFVNVSVGGSTSQLTVRLINLNGQVLQEKIINSVSASTISLPVHNYPAGNYFVQVVQSDGTQQTSKVLITP